VVLTVAFVDLGLENLDALPRDLGAPQPSYQLFGLAAEHAATNDFNPAHSALSHGLVTLVNSAVTVKPTREKKLNHARFLHTFGRVEKHRQTATLGYNELQASASGCR
jgi:hypothetical protein